MKHLVSVLVVLFGSAAAFGSADLYNEFEVEETVIERSSELLHLRKSIGGLVCNLKRYERGRQFRGRYYPKTEFDCYISSNQRFDAETVFHHLKQGPSNVVRGAKGLFCQRNDNDEGEINYWCRFFLKNGRRG